jgi:hypothetical protein
MDGAAGMKDSTSTSAGGLPAVDDHGKWHRAALCAWRRGELSGAVQAARRAIAAAPDVALYHSDLCELLRLTGALDEAVFHGLRATAIEPGLIDAHCHLGMARYDRLELNAAIDCQRRALALDPDRACAHFELAKALLLAGRMAEGWTEYEWRFALPDAPLLPVAHDGPRWDGAPMPRGALLLVADGGYRDVIQFCRYIPAVLSRCPNVVVACSPAMLPVVAQQARGARCETRWEDVGRFDAWCPLSSLPLRFGTTLETIPSPDPYLKADPRRVAVWRERLDRLVPPHYRRIGVAWTGRPARADDPDRSLRLAQLAPLARLDGVALVSLQVRSARQEIGGYFGPAPLVNLGAAIVDFGDTMAIIECLERVVAVDTAVAHLAAAMGRPVSLMLPHAPDWRWLLGRTDTPWYSGMSLYRQPAPRHWDAVIAAVAGDVAAAR